MRRINFTLGITAAAVLMAPAAMAVPSGTASSSAAASIVSPIAISNTTALDFGHLASSATSGTVVLATTGSRSATGGVTLPSLAGITPSQAVFSVTGDPTANFAITLPTSVTLSSGGDTMTLDTFTSNPNATSTIGGGGSSTLNVGATLNVSANQAAGAYTGTFDVSVAYN